MAMTSRASSRAALAAALALALAAQLVMEKREHDATTSALEEALERERARADACERVRRSWWRMSAGERAKGSVEGGRSGRARDAGGRVVLSAPRRALGREGETSRERELGVLYHELFTMMESMRRSSR